jgi:hypothetical protein
MGLTRSQCQVRFELAREAGNASLVFGGWQVLSSATDTPLHRKRGSLKIERNRRRGHDDAIFSTSW